jgi:hypothetical protein
VTQAVDFMLYKHEVLSSNSSATKEKKKNNKGG